MEAQSDAQYGPVFGVGDVTYEGYEFEDHDGRRMLYVRTWCG
ncbi:hypothetical protein [Cryptosporangium japonicum]|uniref:Uncharacterized protein n=1 Tax=Cryptosporangium japonicum TaxID=80872 RepID=A0ABN0THC1_9ACTN